MQWSILVKISHDCWEALSTDVQTPQANLGNVIEIGSALFDPVFPFTQEQGRTKNLMVMVHQASSRGLTQHLIPRVKGILKRGMVQNQHE